MIILDASALYPLVKRSRRREQEVAEKLLREKVALLDLTLYEACNAALIEDRRGIIKDYRKLVLALSRLAENLMVIRVEPDDLVSIGEIAGKLHLTIYDSAYVYYAGKYNVKLVTNDREVLVKAGNAAVTLDEWLGEN